MIILDTNVLSELMKSKPDQGIFNWVDKQPVLSLFTTSITQAEILYGISLLPEGKRRDQLNQADQLIFAEDLGGRIIPFDSSASVAFAMMASKRRRSGKPISQSDGQIAAICYSRGATLVTRNVSDFENCGITIINPWEQ